MEWFKFTYTCKVCGKRETFSALGENREEIEAEYCHLDTCFDCTAKAMHEEYMAMREADMAEFIRQTTVKFVQLTGDPKRIKEAEEYRRKKVFQIMHNYPQADWDGMVATMNKKTSADWWCGFGYLDVNRVINIIETEK